MIKSSDFVRFFPFFARRIVSIIDTRIIYRYNNIRRIVTFLADFRARLQTLA